MNPDDRFIAIALTAALLAILFGAWMSIDAQDDDRQFHRLLECYDHTEDRAWCEELLR